MSWIEIKLNIPPEKLESVSGYLFAQGCEGININDDGVYVYFNQHRWTNEIKMSMVDYIQASFPSFSSRDLKIVNVPDQDWNKNWKQYFKPIQVTSRVVVRPPWEEYRQREGEIVLIINPKMAFGTGHHESTQLIIRAMEKQIKSGMNVLDIGTGSGILAILAEKLGAEAVIAIDNDPQALRNAQENASLNRVKNKVRFFLAQPENLQPSEYDLILANINREVLSDYSNHFAGLLKPGGQLILSGILRRDEKHIVDVYQKAGFTLLDKSALKDWMLLMMKLNIKGKAGKTNDKKAYHPESSDSEWADR